MENKNLILGGGIIVATFVFLRLFLKKGSKVKADRIQVADKGECPLNRIQDEEKAKEDREKYDAFMTQCRKNNPFAGMSFGILNSGNNSKSIHNVSCAERYNRYGDHAFQGNYIDLDCSEEEKQAYKDYQDEQIAKLVAKGYTGEFRPFLSPQSMIAIDKINGKFDKNKNYNKSCGSEVCWVYVDNKWVRES